MANISISDVSPEEYGNLEMTLEKAHAEIAQALEKMKKDQDKIDVLKAETRMMLDELQAS